MTAIKFTPGLQEQAGYLNLVKDAVKPIVPPHDESLLRLIAWVTLDRDGREFMRSLTLEADGSFSQVKRQKLIDKLAELGVTNERIVFAFVEAHVAAIKWKFFNDPAHPDEAQRDIQEKAYQQYTAFLTWVLWEDAQGHEFSMIW
jgi:hypothetical protein